MKLFQSSQDRDLELLSAYLDDELSASERQKLERRLAADSGLRRTLAGLRRVQTTLADLPRVKPPRTFTLKPEMVGQARRAPSRLIPILNYATTIAAILFAVVIGSELATGFQPLAAPLAVQSQNVGQAESAPVVEPAPPSVAQDQTILKQATGTPATESLPLAAQSPCDNGHQEPLTGGGCSGGDVTADSSNAPAAGGAGGGAGETPPQAFSVAVAPTDSTLTTDGVVSNADTLTMTPTPDGTLLRNNATEPPPAALEAPTTASTQGDTDFYYGVSAEAQTVSPLRIAIYVLGGLLAVLLIASVIVRRR
jgi:hypothetical protein